jgi:hypothetical protein
VDPVDPGRSPAFTGLCSVVPAPVTVPRSAVHLPFTKTRESGHLRCLPSVL